MEFPHGVDVDVLSPTATTSKYSTTATLSWSTPTRRRVPRALVYLGVSEETPSSAGTPYRLTGELTAILPYGDPITPQDRLEVLSGPYKGTYSVSGRPAHWLTPWSGWEAGTEVRLKEVTGA